MYHLNQNTLRLLMDNNIKHRIKNIMSAVFEIPVHEIDENSSPDNIESWDSLKHMNLIIALEEEFEIEFTDDEILETMNYALIESIIIEK